MTQEQLIALAERCEQAEGPDRALDYEIHCRNGMQGVGMYGAHPRYTASIDAALTLVPAGWFTALAMEDRHSHSWRWDLRGGYGVQFSARAKTPALALCAASLKAMNQGGE